MVLKRTIPLGEPLAMDLSLSGGKCTVVTLKLDEGSTWSADAHEHGLAFNYSMADSDLSAGPGLIGPGAVSDMGCPGVTGRVPMQIFALGQSRALGTGTATLEVRARGARPGEVSAERRELKESADDSQRTTDRLKREHCSKCRRESRGNPDDFDRCVRQWLRSGECD